MTEAHSISAPMDIYGSKISYYTGKLEAYLRYRNLGYRILPLAGNQKKLIAGTGVSQMPVVQLADGRWMTDTTPILAWLERDQEALSIYPEDSALSFIAFLIEDYADEWLWRPAMHYRWTYRPDRQLAAETLYNEQIRGNLPIPRIVGMNMLKIRQLGGFVRSDGVDRKSREHADQTYLTALKKLEAIFASRPFLLGERPTIADFGMMGPMFRHFGQDPTPAEIMRERAPLVYEWVARIWNLGNAHVGSELITSIDEPLAGFLDEICETHLAQLRQNARAFGAKRKRFNLDVQGYAYPKVPTSRYRVWCLEKLREAWAALPENTQRELRATLSSLEACVLWDELEIGSSNYDPENEAPFNRAINVYADGIPPFRLF